MSEEVLSFPSFESVPPDRLSDYAQLLDFVEGPTEGYQVRVRMAKLGSKTEEERRRVLAARSGKRKPPGVVSAIGREIRFPIDEGKDETIARLRTELEAEKARSRALAATVGIMEAMEPGITVGAKEEVKPVSWQERVKTFVSCLQGKNGVPANQIARERAAKIMVEDRSHPVERPKPKAEGAVMVAEAVVDGEDGQEIERMRQEANRGLARRNRELTLENQRLKEELELAQKKNEELSRPARRKSALKVIAHGVGVVLVLGHFLLGSGGPLPGRRGVESKEKEVEEKGKAVLCSEDNPIQKMEEKIRELESTAEKPVLAAEETPASEKPLASLRVTITGSCFWESACAPVDDWLERMGLVNWVNGKVKLRDVLIKKIVEAARKQGFDLSQVQPGDEFEFKLEENEEVMAAAQTKSFEDYQKFVASAGK